jgi:hypothetical protein|tara:strand:+ start:609 stop:806 length:198 start_codon:yes stop_codon:yes gene_type:complete
MSNSTTEIFWIRNSSGILFASDSTNESYVLGNVAGILRFSDDRSWRMKWGTFQDYKLAVEAEGYC